jgi:hypothetical protein
VVLFLNPDTTKKKKKQRERLKGAMMDGIGDEDKSNREKR